MPRHKRGGVQVSRTANPSHRPPADPAAPLRAALTITVSPADKAAYTALDADSRAIVLATLRATLRAALTEETAMLGAIFVYDGGHGMFVSWKARSMRDRFDLSAEQVQALIALPCSCGIDRHTRQGFTHLRDTPEARAQLDVWFAGRWQA